jgi:hypothetical protein
MTNIDIATLVSDNSGPYRILRTPDEVYIVGHGMCCILSEGANAEALIEQLARAKEADEYFDQVREDWNGYMDQLSKNSVTLK